MANLNDFSKARVLVVGDLMLDRYWWGRVERISPEAPVPVVRLERTTIAPGGAANVALNVASLGGTPILISTIGEDAEGEELVTALQARGVSGDALVSLPDRKTSVKTRIIAHSQQVTRVDSEITQELLEHQVDALIGKIEWAIERADLVIISDYAKGVLTEPLLCHLISLAKSSGKPVLVDPKGKDYQKYAGATLLTPNRREAAEACKLEESDPEMVLKAGKTLLDDFELEKVLITEGENGMTLFDRDNESFHLDAAVHKVYDVTGAGDSVIACLGVAMAARFTVKDSCKLANIAGGLSVEQLGTYAVPFRSLENAAAKEGLS